MIAMRVALWILYLTLMIVISLLDYWTGKAVAIWSVYLIPIALASWMQGFRTGLMLTVLAILLSFAVEIEIGTDIAMSLYFFMLLINRAAAMIAIAWFASQLFKKQQLESTLKSYDDYLDYLNVSPEHKLPVEASNTPSTKPGVS